MYYNNKDVRVEEMPTPRISYGELLVKVIASGICGSDVMEWYRIKRSPLVLGHEIAGEIVEVGDGVEHYKIGERVFVSHHVPCNRCHYCLNGNHTVCDTLRSTNFDPGGFAEYIRVPEIHVDRGVFQIPDETSYEEATFIEPLACTLRAQRLAEIRPGESVLVIGSGISGMLHIAIASASCLGKVIATDIERYRLNVARKLGADEVIHAEDDVPGRVSCFNKGRLADLVIVCAGAISAFNQALKCVDRGGRVVLFAPLKPDNNLQLPLYDIWRDGIKLIPSYGASPLDIEQSIELIRSRRIDVKSMITHILRLEETGLGFQIVANAKESIKVIIEPHK